MALDAELMLVGERQGLIIGASPGRPAERVVSVIHQIVVPRSPATGLSTAKRHHKPLTFRREVNAASIALQQAFADMENFTEVRLRFFQTTAFGTPKQHLTIQLFNAGICSLRMVLPDSRPRSRTQERLSLWEEVSLSYLTIRWTWTDPQMVAEDDWLIAR